jgi:RNA polymerase sigma-70 factor (ECF subfamily)
VNATGDFQQLALKYLDTLHNYARILTRDPSTAEDLLQETLVRAYRGFGSYDPALSAKVWLLKIMKNANIDRCRRQQARPVEEPLPEDPGPDRSLSGDVPLNPEEILLQRLAIDEVRAAIRRLPPLWREAVELRDIEGLSYQEIADVLGSPVGTVMSRLYRGRNLVRSLLLERPVVQSRENRGV